MLRIEMRDGEQFEKGEYYVKSLGWVETFFLLLLLLWLFVVPIPNQEESIGKK